MKKLSTLLVAALLAAPAVMAADVTVSLHERKGTLATITIGDLLGTMTNTLSYDEATGVYSLTNFLGYEKGNLNFTIDSTEKFTSENGQERIPIIFSVPEGSIIEALNGQKSKWGFHTTDVDLDDEENPINLDDFYDMDSGVFTGNDKTEYEAVKLVDSNLWGVCEETSAVAFENIKKRAYAVASAAGYEFVIEVQAIGIRYSYGSGYSYDDNPAVGLNYVAVFQNSGSTGVEEIIAAQEGEAEYFNLLGARIENPTNGLYIKRQGGKTQKVIIR